MQGICAFPFDITVLALAENQTNLLEASKGNSSFGMLFCWPSTLALGNVTFGGAASENAQTFLWQSLPLEIQTRTNKTKASVVGVSGPKLCVTSPKRCCCSQSNLISPASYFLPFPCTALKSAVQMQRICF